jgi:glycosyltransferase involved in cell wall biosynthesis
VRCGVVVRVNLPFPSLALVSGHTPNNQAINVMNIGVYARQLAGPMIGARRALEAVLREWAELGTNGHSIFLYSPHKFELDFVHPFHYRIGSGIGKLAGGSLWLQTELPRMARQDAINVFWATLDIAPLPLSRQIPTLLTVHDLGFFEIPGLLSLYVRCVYGLLFRRSLSSTKKITCTTDAMRKDLLLLGCTETQIEVIHHGVDMKVFVPSLQLNQVTRMRYGLPDSYFLFVGHLRPNKNLERTLLAFKLFLSQCSLDPKPCLVLVGGRTPTDGSIMELLQDPALKEHVRYLGYVSESDLSCLYHDAVGFVCPSIYEGFGLPFLEALAAGLPVIAPSIPTALEVCGDAAIYVDPLSIDSIASGFQTLWEIGNARESYSRKAKDRAEQFSWSLAANRTLQVLEELVPQKSLS